MLQAARTSGRLFRYKKARSIRIAERSTWKPRRRTPGRDRPFTSLSTAKWTRERSPAVGITITGTAISNSQGSKPGIHCGCHLFGAFHSRHMAGVFDHDELALLYSGGDLFVSAESAPGILAAAQYHRRTVDLCQKRRCIGAFEQRLDLRCKNIRRFQGEHVENRIQERGIGQAIR